MSRRRIRTDWYDSPAMYAILSHGGHQYKVAPGDRLLVDRLSAEIGSEVKLGPVVYLAGEGKSDGQINSSAAQVIATVLAHPRGPKLRVFKYKAKKRNRRTLGHRSDLTELRVEKVSAEGTK